MTTTIETAFSYLDMSHPTIRDALAEIEGLRRDAQRYRKAVAIGWLNTLVTENLDQMIEKDKA